MLHVLFARCILVSASVGLCDVPSMAVVGVAVCMVVLWFFVLVCLLSYRSVCVRIVLACVLCINDIVCCGVGVSVCFDVMVVVRCDGGFVCTFLVYPIVHLSMLLVFPQCVCVVKLCCIVVDDVAEVGNFETPIYGMTHNKRIANIVGVHTNHMIKCAMRIPIDGNKPCTNPCDGCLKVVGVEGIQV